MSNFEMAFKLLLTHEGGFIDNPQDLGGPTNLGVTQNDLSHFYNRPVTVEEIKNLTQNAAKVFYKIKYWNLMNLDQIENAKIAAILFDQGVLRGPNRMIQDVQHSLGLDPDGIIGPVTISSINQQKEIDMGIKIIKASQLAFAFIVQQRPSQVEFLTGWITRTHSLIDFLLFSS